jgi:hypothetical protein
MVQSMAGKWHDRNTSQPKLMALAMTVLSLSIASTVAAQKNKFFTELRGKAARDRRLSLA